MLAVRHLEKTYKHRKVVGDVSLDIEPGEIVGLLGPNGAGKTTCFYSILGLVQCDKGTITLNEKDITAKPVHERAKLGIGYLPQEPSVFRKLNVEDNIRAILQTRKNLTSEKKERLLEELLNEFNIQHVRTTLGMSLSGGERRRVEIARALSTDPQFILLDEPFAGVDPLSINDIKDIITHLSKRKIGVIITDHNVRETLSICHRAYIMNSGQMIAQGSPEEVLANPEVRKVYLGDQFTI